MKKKIAVFAGIALAMVMAVGCSQYSSKIIEEIDNASIFDNISEEDLINGDDFNTAFSTALTEVNDSANITVNSENMVTLGEGEKVEKTDYKSEVKIAKEDDKSTGSAVMDNEYNDNKSSITAYYDGSKLYFTTNDGDKIVEEMAFEDFMSVVNSYSLSVFPECIDKSACVEGKNGIKEYYMSYNPTSLENQMKTNLEASGQSQTSGENMIVNYSNLYAKLDKDGNLLTYVYALDAKYTNDSGEQPYKYTIKVDFTNRDKTKVDAVSNTDDYMTTDEYTQLLQERMAEEATAEDSSAAEEGDASEEAASTAENAPAEAETAAQ